ncbi:hypothetical protein [Methylorubrum thiocyanatum]
MTAEIVIINQQAVALAADSALTIGKQRVWKHANKIFSAGPEHDIGIMIYNSGDFLSIPWEILIKEFRNSVASTQFDHLASFADAFLDFVKSDRFGGTHFEELSFGLIFSDVVDTIEKIAEYSNRTEFYKEIIEIANLQLNDLQDVAELRCPFSEEEFTRNYSKVIVGIAKNAFKFRLPNYIANKIVNLCYEHVKRETTSEYSTGVIITGYGKQELFPSVRTIYVDGRSMGLTRAWIGAPRMDLNVSRSQNAAIIPFAQIDMAKLFMEGISDRYVSFMSSTLRSTLMAKVDEMIKLHVQDKDVANVERILQEKQIDAMMKVFEDNFSAYRGRYFTKPILDTIRALPKEEMAYMARSMVEITALRRRFASAVESVGGDIDVAVISKSDGFIWIHRKHYFNIDSNPDFMHRRTGRRGG